MERYHLFCWRWYFSVCRNILLSFPVLLPLELSSLWRKTLQCRDNRFDHSRLELFIRHFVIDLNLLLKQNPETKVSSLKVSGTSFVYEETTKLYLSKLEEKNWVINAWNGRQMRCGLLASTFPHFQWTDGTAAKQPRIFFCRILFMMYYRLGKKLEGQIW